ncbi:hypothetical protein O6V14_03045 [Sphingomonas faeni]
MTRNQNDPARKGEAVECLLAGDIDGYSSRPLQLQTLQSRFALPIYRAAIVAELAWGRANG